MAESSSSVLPGDVEWLPGPGGSRLLRIHPPSPEPPALILRTADGAESRFEAGSGPQTEYEIPGELDWDSAWLAWPDGTRTAIPAPHGRAAQVIELRPRRFRPSADADGSDAPLPLPRGFVRVPASIPRSDAAAPAGPAWTTPPQLADSTGGEGEWRDHREGVERELAQAAGAIARAREGERLAREAVLTALTAARADLRAVRAARDADASAFAALSGELEAERSAHAVTRGSIGTLADALAAARAELAGAREAAELARAAGQEARATVASARRDAALARAEAASLRAALETERAARESAETELRELNDRAGLLERVAELDRDAAGLRDQVELERRAREQAEAAAAAARRPPEEAKRLLADLDAAAAALRSAGTEKSAQPPATHEPRATPIAPTRRRRGGDAPDAGRRATPTRDAAPTAAPRRAAAAPAAARRRARRRHAGRGRVGDATPAVGRRRPPRRRPRATPRAPAGDAPAAPSTALVRADAERRLRKALLALSHEDATAAGALLIGLLPAQGAVIEGSLSYDLTVRGIGTFGVFVEDGSARVVRLSRKRPRGQALFHLAGDPSTLAELLAGERTKLTRFRRKGRVTGRRKRARELAPLPEARLSLSEAVKAGARLEPGLVYRALPFAIEPEWTKGHRFTVAQQIVELSPLSWHVSARDGLPLRVVEHTTDAPADATVTMSRAAFERLLKDEPQPLGDRPVIRGDREAVAALKRWTDLARGT